MSSRPLLLDLFCGAGGCAVGYHRAGFDVVGVDVKSQPRYPFKFQQADAMEYLAEHGREFDAIHASPPCQKYSKTQRIWGREYVDLLRPIRNLLMETRQPYVIENVEEAPLCHSTLLCGTMFGLRTYRHRRFESSAWIFQPEHTRHRERTVATGRPVKVGQHMTVAGHFSNVAAARHAMGIDWMTRDELSQAIPPAYTEYIGRQLTRAIE